MNFQLIDRNKKHMDAISKAVKDSEEVLLATDPDREGEAIAWHIAEILNSKKLIKNKKIARIIFGEITKNAIIDALKEPREIASALVHAQQARQALDYLIAFNLSPLLWSKIRYGLSAGRVQSPALRLITEREKEIEKFIKKEYINKTEKHFEKLGLPCWQQNAMGSYLALQQQRHQQGGSRTGVPNFRAGQPACPPSPET